jgi:Zn-dependent metalloprotease
VLEAIAENGTEKQRDIAVQTLELSDEIRADRAESAVSTLRVRRLQKLYEGIFEQPWLAIPEEFNLERYIYDAEKRQRLPGRLVRSEGDSPSDDVAVNEAYDGLGFTFNFFAEEYGRNSIDNRGMKLDASVHYGVEYDNAFWDSKQMVFGDGAIFNRFTSSLDVIGHELTHGVTEREAGLLYFRQAGALNEHISDVFGSLIKQWNLKQSAAEADWLIGAELVQGTKLNAVALRSMKDPGSAYDDKLLGGQDPQPDHMDHYVKTNQDNGGVHINSGIPNYAFYLAATNIGGNAWEEAGLVWYTALTSQYARPLMQFRGFAGLTIWTANQLFGPGDIVPQAIAEAWREVGVL